MKSADRQLATRRSTIAHTIVHTIVHAIAVAIPSLCAWCAVEAQSPPRIPLEAGVTITSTLAFPAGDRDNVVVVQSASAEGARYVWRVLERTASGERAHRFSRFVRGADLRGAPRLNYTFREGATETHPGFTAFSISSASYDSLVTVGSVRYTIVELDNAFGDLGGVAGAIGSLLTSTVTLKGRLTATSRSPEPFPVLVNGRRVTLPALRLGGRFGPDDGAQVQQFWVLADRSHPLILRIVTGPEVFEVTRIDVPVAERPVTMERELTTQCRTELSGIYFAFGSAELDPASGPALRAAADMLGRHRDWRLTIEGHTDSVGGRSANLALSERRAAAVRQALTASHGVAADQLDASGFGDRRPREPNTTVAGRARNRRVEMARACAPGNQ